MKLYQLRIFMTICHCNNSLSMAAKRAMISQSAVSQAISELEEEFGIKLFHRINKKLQLTYEGEEFLRECEQILQKVDALKANMLEISHEETTLSLGINLMHSKYMISRFYFDFIEQYPDIHINLHESMSRELTRMLHGGQLHAAIINQEANYDQELQQAFTFLPLKMREQLSFCTYPGNALASKKVVTWEEISSEPLVFLRSSENSNIMNVRYFAEHGLVSAKSNCVNQISSVVASILERQASTIIDGAAVYNEPHIITIPIKGSEQRNLCLAVARNRQITPELQILIDFLQKIDFMNTDEELL